MGRQSTLQHGLIIAAITLAVVIVYGPVARHGFIVYDDDAYVARNPHVLHGLSGEGFVWAFKTYHGGNWHPLTWLSHMIDAQIVGDRAGAHHAINMLYHLANCVLLYLLLARMTGASAPSALVALLFAAHSLHVESVAWVSERKDTLSTLFGLLALLAYVAYVQRPSRGRYAGVCALFVASLMAKPMLVTFPFVLLLLDYWPLKRLGNLGEVVLEKVVLLGLTAVGCVVAVMAQSHAGATAGLIPVGSRIANAAVSYVEYLRKTFVPSDLALGYPHPAILGERISPLRVAVCAAILVAITAVALWQRKRRPWLIVGWLWYLGTLVPVIGLLQVGSQGLADRYTYVPLIGIFIMIAWTIFDAVKSSPAAAAVRAGAATVLVVACVIVARRQVGYWRDTFTLFDHTLAVAPKSYTAHDCLGVAYQHLGRPDLAMEHYRASLALFPSNAQTHNSIGVLLYEQNDFRQAIEHYVIALRGQPQFVDAHNNLANALEAIGRGDLALEHYEAALALDPDLAQAHNNLGLLLAERGKIDEATSHFRHAVRSDPNYANAHYSLALALGVKGRFEEAIEEDRKALAIKPDFPAAANHLAQMKRRLEDYRFASPAATQPSSQHNR